MLEKSIAGWSVFLEKHQKEDRTRPGFSWPFFRREESVCSPAPLFR